MAIVGDVMRVGDAFRIVGILQARGGRWRRVADATGEFLGKALQEQKHIVKRVIGPLLALGRQDIIVVLDCFDLEDGVSCFWSCMGHVATTTRDLVRFSFVTGFLWDLEPVAPRTGHYSGLVMLKLTNDRSYYGDRLLTPAVARKLDDFAQSWDGGIGWELWGGLSWHECMCMVRSTDYRALLHLTAALQEMPEVVVATSIPLIERGADGRPLPTGLEGVQVVTRVGVDDSAYRDGAVRIDGISAEAGDRLTHFGFGRYPLLALNEWVSSDDLLAFCGQLNTSPNLSHHASELMFPLVGDKLLVRSEEVVVPAAVPTIAASTSPRLPSASPREGVVPALRLLELETQIMLLPDSRTLPLGLPEPSRLLEAVAKIRTQHNCGELSDQAVLYFASEIETAIIERTAGAALDPLEAGGAPVWHIGGCQRLTIACERLLSACFRHHSKWHLGAGEIRPPVMLAFFEHNRGTPTHRQEIEPQIGAGRALPLIVRLPLLKYKPWLWPLGIGMLAANAYSDSPGEREGTRSEGLLAVMSEGRVPTSGADRFIRQFVTYGNFGRMLAEDLNLTRQDGGAVAVNPRLLDYLIIRLQRVRAETRADKAAAPGGKAITYRDGLVRGQVFGGVLEDYDELVAFLNAYLSLEPRWRRAPQALTSFLISLNKSPLWRKEVEGPCAG